MCWSELTECRSKYCVTRNGSLREIPINNHGSVSSMNSSNKFRLMVCRLFHPPILNMDRPISTFGSILAPITKFFTNFHSSRRSGPILHSWRCSESIFHSSRSSVLSKFSKFSHPSRSSDYFSKFSPRGRWDMSNSQSIHLIHFSWDLRHLLFDTKPTLLRCNDSFVHPFRSMHPTQKCVRRHQHDLTSAQVRTPADSVSPLAGYSTATVGSEDAAALGASCSNRTVFLTLSGCSSLAASDPLLPTWMSLILSSSCWSSLMSPPDASACRTAIGSSSLFPGSLGASPALRSTRSLFLSFTRSVSAILSLYAFILAFPVKVLSMIVLIRSPHSSLCGFVVLPCDASAAQPGQPPVCPWASMSADKT